MFANFANRAARAMASPWAFVLAAAGIAGWLAVGIAIGFSDTYQLVANTFMSTVTFLAVFLLQHSQNRDTHAMQIKLDELIASTRDARNELIELEGSTDEDMDSVREKLLALKDQDATRFPPGSSGRRNIGT